jgi:hypothetical protein
MMPAQNMSTLGCCNRVQLVAGYIDFTFLVHGLLAKLHRWLFHSQVPNPMFLKSNEQFEQFVLRQSLCYVTGSDSIGKKLTHFKIRNHKSDVINSKSQIARACSISE